jgi:signal recognition particle subunit SRP54
MHQPTFDLEWFLGQLQKMKSMGPMSELIKMVPGMSEQMGRLDIDESPLHRSAAIVLAMTPWERRHPGLIDASRQERIAKGSGVRTQDISEMLANFYLISGSLRELHGRHQ